MFEIKFLVDDNKLKNAMWALDGIAAEPPTILPVRGAKATASGVVATTSGVSYVHQVTQALQSMSSPITYAQIRKMLEQVGASGNGAGYMLSRLIDRKVLKKTGKGLYTIIGPGKGVSPNTYLANLKGENLVAKVANLIKEQNIAVLSLNDLGQLTEHAGGSKSTTYFIKSQLLKHGILANSGDGNLTVIS